MFKQWLDVRVYTYTNIIQIKQFWGSYLSKIIEKKKKSTRFN